MADWRQIQARIRKAKASSDPAGQLAAIYERTRDAMVAFELAKLSEKSAQTDEAVRWYTAAAERFRRAQWRTKAAEALSRLGDHNERGPLTLEQLLTGATGHIHHHVKFIKEKRQALGLPA